MRTVLIDPGWPVESVRVQIDENSGMGTEYTVTIVFESPGHVKTDVVLVGLRAEDILLLKNSLHAAL